MFPLDFPNSPSNGATYTASGKTWTYNGTGWTLNNAGASAGGDLTGTYPNPTVASGAISTAKLADSAVTNAKLAPSAVTVSVLDSTVGNFGALTSYTPALTAATTNPNLGTSPTQLGYYTQIGKLVIGRARIMFGTGASVSAGSGTYYFSLPVAMKSTMDDFQGNPASLYDSSTGNYFLATTSYQTSTTIRFFYPATYGGAFTQAGSGAPWTWAAGDQLSVQFMYEAA